MKCPVFMSEIPHISQKVDCPPPKNKISYFLLIPFDSASKVIVFKKSLILVGKF